MDYVMFVRRVLEVLTLSGVLRLGLFALCRLTFLEEFLFRYSSRRQMEELVELLPNLHIIGSKLEMQKFTDDDDQYLEHKVSSTSLIEI